MEKTLVVFKPDAVMRGIVGEIISRFEKVGLKIIGCKMLQPDYKHFHDHYEGIGTMITRRGQEKFDFTLEMMQEGPVIAIVLEGIEAVSLVRKMVGDTEPKSSAPGTIRGDYAHISYSHGDSEGIGLPNIVHASGDSEEAAKEVAHWFNAKELYDYEASHQHYTQAKTRRK